MNTDLRALRQQPFQLVRQLEAILRASRQDTADGEEQYWTGLGFRIADHWFLVPNEEVSEVTNLPPMTRVPGARPWLLGVANFRGNLLPICDLSRLLGFDHDRVSPVARVLVFNSERVPFGFLVDEVAGYRQFVPGEQRHELVEAQQELKGLLLGAFVRDGQPWLALSLHKAVASNAFKNVGW